MSTAYELPPANKSKKQKYYNISVHNNYEKHVSAYFFGAG